MLSLLWLIPVLPFVSCAALALFGSRWRRPIPAVVGSGAVGVSTLLAILITIRYLAHPPPGGAYTETLWTWFRVGGFAPGIAFYLDSLSLIMALVVCFVGLLIHVYSAGFMYDEDGYARFFAYMNLFVGSMLTLVLADNLLLLYLGWEGVGLCSYLLIGFWHRDPANGYAARKAFVVTRVGDTAMAIGLFLLLTHLGTLHIQELMHRAAADWPMGSALPVAAAALLLGGAVGKSAQLPLQTWLPDAMAGPTPVSALIHAATMVTAGVYLIARTHVLFALAPPVQLAVAVIGAATLLLAGFSALTQYDIKRVLAYSTVSQIGYMFLALGVGAWSAAIFHFMTHAFFKALLFLAAGAVILAVRHEHDMRKMGGLRAELPVVFWTFLAGACSLAALPLVTAGFYSKDLILWRAWSSPIGGPVLWAAGIAGAFLTSLYTFRMVFMTFFGAPREATQRALPIRGSGASILAPLIVLGILSVVGGFVEIPEPLGDKPFFSGLLRSALPAAGVRPEAAGQEWAFEVIAAIVCIAGIGLAYALWLRAPRRVEAAARTPAGAALHRFWFAGWGFDWLYDRLIVWPYMWLARANRGDVVDLPYAGIAWANQALWRLLRRTETGSVRWYAAAVAFGAIVIIAIVVLS
ncbi:MAG: NADH-quinone oxidoreductase subunit L [Chthonomonadales bacterium]|nr:NADH-quinone oxidoreductase subunit L [Chthonomonadales bacterium]